MSIVKSESDDEAKNLNGQQEKGVDTSTGNNTNSSSSNAKEDSDHNEASSVSIPHDQKPRHDSSADLFDETTAHEKQQAGLQDTSGEDYSPTPQESKPSSITSSNRNRSFPAKLMAILDSEEYKDIFAWTKSGKSFSIYKPYDLINKVLVVHFDGKCDMKFDSFLRKLYRWGFTKRSSSDEIDGEGDGGQVYFHENFQRGNYKLCALMNCNSKPTTNRPMAKGNGSTMHQYNPYYGHGMLNAPPLDFVASDPIQMQMQLQLQQQYLSRLYQQQQLQNLSVPNSLPYPYGQTSQGFITRQRQEQEMMLLHQQQLHFSNFAQQAHPSSQYQTMAGPPTMAPRGFGYLPDYNTNAQMYNFAQQSLGNSAFAKVQNNSQSMNSQTNRQTNDRQLLGQESMNHEAEGSCQEKPGGGHLSDTNLKEGVTSEETAKRKSDFEDIQKDKTQRVASHKDGNDVLDEDK
eukprot:CAMPEP_0176487994 /NCGR_PEP_ID=MMETSP0200_2-20121128/6454_1 /TAXON_ID=947934 /ORGANISM="Chaetoceros sp., Strain GSL56" /LENGTH=458 /DNA_ID=CAMNT_0017884911 /DNA_START=133 /DNA_END=1509 /DNA_ORIENTATION=+